MPVVQLQPFARHTVSLYRPPMVSAASADPARPLAVAFARDLAQLKDRARDQSAFFVADVDRVRQLLQRWRRALPRVRPFYHVNCNPDPVLLAELARQQPAVGFSCTTKSDLAAVLEACTERADKEHQPQPADILYNNPCWTRSAVQGAADADVRLLGFDSARDLERIARSHPGAQLLLNVDVEESAEMEETADMEEAAALAGCALADAADLLQLTADLGLRCVGVAVQLRRAADGAAPSASRFRRAVARAAALLRFGQHVGHTMHVLSLGGGFEAAVAGNGDNDDRDALGENFERLGAALSRALDELLPRDEWRALRILATPGRFFAAPVFSLVTNVVGKQRVPASRLTNDDFDDERDAFVYRTNEGSAGAFGALDMRVRAACTPLFDQPTNMNNSAALYEEMNVADGDEPQLFWSSVLGSAPSWDGTEERLDDGDEEDQLDQVDQLVSRFNMKQLFVGDWLLWTNMGAYSMHKRASLDAEFGRDLPVYYVADGDSRFTCPMARQNSDDSDADSGMFEEERSATSLSDVASEVSVAEAGADDDNETDKFSSDESDDEEGPTASVWAAWMAAFEGRERASHSFSF